MQGKMFNAQIFLEFLCYSVFGVMIFYLATSGKYLSYVTPRMKPYLYFTAIVMLTWAIFIIGRLFHPQYKMRSAHCFVLVIPILLICIPHKPLTSTDFANNYVSGESTFTGNSKLSDKKQKSYESDSINSVNNYKSENLLDTITVPDKQVNTSEDSHLPGLDVINKKITISNNSFGIWLAEFYGNMQKYIGYTVVTTGYVFRDPKFTKVNEFVTARLIMSCCVADLTPGGLICKYNKSDELKDNSWVTVEGIIFIEKINSDGNTYDDLRINVKKVTPAEKINNYVYPY